MAISEDLIPSADLFPFPRQFAGFGAVGCALMEHDGRIVSVTHSFASMLESEVELFFGLSIFDLLTLENGCYPRDLLTEGKTLKVRLKSDDAFSWTIHRIAPGAILGGYFIGLLWHEGGLEGLEQRLVHRDRLAALGRLTAGMAHEIAGPLNIIANNAELLLDDEELGTAARDGLKTMRDEALRLCSALHDILNFARNVPAKIQGHDPVQLVKKSLELFTPHLSRRAISWSIEAEPNLPLVGGEEGPLQQVFFNLFKNAWDASPDRGEIVVYIRRQRPNREDALIEFVIADQGVGIAPADLKRIYEPFFTTKPADQGTGLGLAIVQQILAACGGSLRLASFPGEGTRATVLLPIFTMSEPVNNGKV